MSGEKLSAAQARWLALRAQGIAGPRPARPATRGQIVEAVEALGLLQVDAINVVERTQFLALFSRLGRNDPKLLVELAGPGGSLFEYWGRAASLLPVSSQPLFRWRMAQSTMHGDTTKRIARMRAWRDAHADYIERVKAEITDRGPLAASQLTDPRRRDGAWWARRSVGRQAMEFLFLHGELAAWRTANFERVYDLPERVLPASVLATPTPPVEEAHRGLIAIAARAQGIGTLGDLAGYFRVPNVSARHRVRELVESGDLVEARVEGWPQPAYLPASSRPSPPRRQHATLLSPFDTIVAPRERAARLFGFEFLFEVYVPAPKRQYGYFVLPLALGDQIVARFDIKADRQASVLRIHAAFGEPGIDVGATATAAAEELDALRRWLGLDGITVARQGDFAGPVQKAIAARG